MNDLLITLFLPIALAIAGSTGFWSYLQSKTDKSKQILESIDNVKKDVTNLKSNFEETEAKNCRNRIVRFADEIRAGSKKSKDYYDHIMNDIDTYQTYCDNHKGFMNGIAEVSIKKIKQHYEQDDFL